MPAAFYWNIYKIFNDPPGKQGIKCIECRYATAAASSVVGLGGAYGVYRTFMGNVYKGMGFVFVSLVGFGFTVTALRSAKEERKWNERRIREAMEKLSKERGEFKSTNKLPS